MRGLRRAKPLRYVFLLCTLVQMLSSNARAFQDPSARQNALLFNYMDSVSEEIGLERFESVSFEYVFALARQLGQIERFNLTSEAFFEHVHEAVSVKNTFEFAGSPMSDRTFTHYVLPLRIRYESTARGSWRSFFKERLGSSLEGLGTDQAIETILTHLTDRVTLDAASTYDLGYRGDLDPIATYLGQYGDEVDLSILACAALRSFGVPARLAYTPHVQETQGGKVWLEYMNSDADWQCWVPQFAQSASPQTHHAQIVELLADRTGIIFAHPADPIEITETYCPTREVNFKPTDQEKVREQYNVAFFSGGFLRPIRGMELTSVRTENPKRQIASEHFWTFVVQNDVQVLGQRH